MFSQNLRMIPIFALFLSMAVHGSLYGILSTGKSYSCEKLPPIPIEIIYPDIRKEEIPKLVEKPVVKKLSLSPAKTVPLLPPVPGPEHPKDEKPAPLPEVNPLQMAENTESNETEPILVPFSPEKPPNPGAPPAAVDQPMGKESVAGTGGTGTGSGEGEVAHMGPVRRTLGEETGPSFKKKVIPVYPRYAQRINKEGMVLLEVLIDRNGLPKDVNLLKRAGFGFDEAAKEAILCSKFHPAMEKGMPIPCLVSIPIRFEIR